MLKSISHPLSFLLRIHDGRSVLHESTPNSRRRVFELERRLSNYFPGGNLNHIPLCYEMKNIGTESPQPPRITFQVQVVPAKNLYGASDITGGSHSARDCETKLMIILNQLNLMHVSELMRGPWKFYQLLWLILYCADVNKSKLECGNTHFKYFRRVQAGSTLYTLGCVSRGYEIFRNIGDGGYSEQWYIVFYQAGLYLLISTLMLSSDSLLLIVCTGPAFFYAFEQNIFRLLLKTRCCKAPMK